MTQGTPRQEVLLNQSRISFYTGGGSFTAYSNTVSTPVVGPVISLFKSTASSEVHLGAPVTFSIAVANSGNREAEVVLYEVMPEGTEFVPNSVHRDGAPYPGANPIAGIPLGVIGISESTLVSFQLVVTANPPSGQIVNQARADYSFQATGGRVLTGSVLSNRAALSVQVLGRPEISVFLAVDKARVTPGGVLRYTVLVNNFGDLAADVALLPGIPAGALFVRNSITVNGLMRSGDFPPSGIALGLVTPRTQVIVTFDVSVPGYGAASPGEAFLNQVPVRAAYISPDSGAAVYETGASNSVLSEMFFPIIKVEVSPTPTVVAPGEIVQYIVHLSNGGNLAAIVNLGRLLPGQMSLLPGSIGVNGVPAADPGPSGAIFAGISVPGEALEITYQAVVSPLVMTPVLRGSIAAYYIFEVEGSTFNGEVSSNGYALTIDAGGE